MGDLMVIYHLMGDLMVIYQFNGWFNGDLPI